MIRTFIHVLAMVGLAHLCTNSLSAAEKPVKTVLLLGQGPDGHPPATHEFHAGLRILETCLARVPGVKVERLAADEPWTAGPEKLKQADGVVLYLSEGAKWMQTDPRRHDGLTSLAARGGGLVAWHWGMGCKDDAYVAGGLKLLGGCHGGKDRKYTVLETTVSPAAHCVAEVASGVAPFRVRDEFYFQLKFAEGEPKPAPLLAALIEGRAETVAWTWERPTGGRSCGFSGGHFHENWRLPEYRRLAVQAVLWSVRVSPPPAGVNIELDAAAFELPAAETRPGVPAQSKP